MARIFRRTPKGRFSIGWRLPALATLLLASWNPNWMWVAQPAQIFVVIDHAGNLDEADLQRQWNLVANSLAYLPSDSRISVFRLPPSSSTTAQLLIDNKLTQDLQLGTLDALIDAQTPEQTSGRTLLARLTTANLGGKPPTLLWLGNRQLVSGKGQAMLQSLQQQGFAPQFKVDIANAVLTAGVAVSALELPLWLSPGTNLPWQLSLISTTNQPATLEVSLNNGTKTVRQLQLRAHQEHNEQGLIATDISTASTSEPIQFRITTTTGEVKQQRLINFRGTRSALYISQPESNTTSLDPQPPLVSTLRNQGWQVDMRTPDQLAALLQETTTLPVLLLDNLAIEDMPDAAWQQLLHRVRFGGSGLIVLGGTRAFGLGGYRHSVLEAALPVTAEPSQPKRPAAVLFVIDQSGSMDAKVAGKRRLDYARTAVLGSAEMLQTGDAIGVLGFANRTREWLPLAVHIDSSAQISSHWSRDIGGATKLAPALTQGIRLLSKSPMQQRLLVLVTDGFTETVDAALIQQQLARHNIDLIALSIGPDANRQSLSKLTGNPGSKLLSVANTAELPQLMRNNVALQRSALERKAVQPVTVKALPYGPAQGLQWPTLTGFLSTKARPGATVYLSTPEGDPLLVAQQYGVGNVIVLPAGVDQFAPSWPQWEGWAALVGGLAQWVNGGADPSRLHLQLTHEEQQSQLLVSTVTGNGTWDSTSKLIATLATPNNKLVDLALEPVAPGSYRARLPLPAQGEYRIAVTTNTGASSTLKFNHDASQLVQSENSEVGARSTATLVDLGKLPRWPSSQQQIDRLVIQQLKSPTQSLWLALGLSIFASGLILEARLNLRNFAQFLQAQLKHMNFIARLQHSDSKPQSTTTPLSH